MAVIAETDLLTRFLEHEAQRVSAQNANATLEAISQVLKFAHKHHYAVGNAADEVKRLYAGEADLVDQSDDSLIGWPYPGKDEVRLIISTYYSQNDDDLLLKEAEKIEFGL